MNRVPYSKRSFEECVTKRSLVTRGGARGARGAARGAARGEREGSARGARGADQGAARESVIAQVPTARERGIASNGACRGANSGSPAALPGRRDRPHNLPARSRRVEPAAAPWNKGDRLCGSPAPTVRSRWRRARHRIVERRGIVRTARNRSSLVSAHADVPRPSRCLATRGQALRGSGCTRRPAWDAE